MRRAFFAASLIASFASCGGPPPADHQKVVSDYYESLRPLLKSFEAGYDGECQRSRVRELQGEGVFKFDADAVAAVVDRRPFEPRLELGYRLPAPSGLDGARLKEAADAVAEFARKPLVLFFRIDQLDSPAIGPITPVGLQDYARGRVAVTTLYLEYPSGKPLCRTRFEAVNTPRMTARGKSKEDFERAILKDLSDNAAKELQKIEQSFF